MPNLDKDPSINNRYWEMLNSADIPMTRAVVTTGDPATASTLLDKKGTHESN